MYYKYAKEEAKKITTPVVIERYAYGDGVKERVDFLAYLMNNAPSFSKLPIHYIFKLWAMLCEDSVYPSDSLPLLQFLKEIAGDQIKVTRAKFNCIVFDEFRSKGRAKTLYRENRQSQPKLHQYVD